MVEIPQEITRFYKETAEEGRLGVGPGQLEFARTKEVVLRHLPPAPATVLDVGGAAGAYALWLAGLGYKCISSMPFRDTLTKPNVGATRQRIGSLRAGWEMHANCRSMTAWGTPCCSSGRSITSLTRPNVSGRFGKLIECFDRAA